jgi:ATP-binding cassette, subfamily B, multidrug efflux pump
MAMPHLRALLPYARPYRRGIALGLLLVVAANVFTAAGPWVLRQAIDALAVPETTRRELLGLAGLLVAMALVGGAAKYGMRELLNGLSRRMECDLRDDLFRHLLRLDAGFYGRWRTGDLMSRLTHDTLAVRQAAGPGIMYAVNTTVLSAFALTLMLWISPALTGLALIPMVFLPPVMVGFGRVIQRRFEAIQAQFSALSTLVQENLTGTRVIRAYVQEENQALRFDALNQAYLERNLRLVRVQGLLHPLLALLTSLGMVVVLGFGGRQVMAGALSVGDFVAFTFYLGLLTWPLIALGWVITLFQRGEASMGRLLAILQTPPALDPAGGRPLDPATVRGALEFQGVGFRYPGSERWVLRGVSFRVEAGETLAVVGPTGSGKSTLLALVARIYDPTEGVILLDGVPLTELNPGDLRRALGVVPQDAFLFSDTLRANLGLGLGLEVEVEGDREARIQEASQRAQLHEQATSLPKGYETLLGERGINLSGGQKQRATLARALARDPRILLLDDALSAVDTQTEAQILEGLRVALRGRTALLVSHRATAVMEADRILVLEEGRPVEVGPHSTLMEGGGWYAELLKRQLLEAEVEAEVAAEAGISG